MAEQPESSLIVVKRYADNRVNTVCEHALRHCAFCGKRIRDDELIGAFRSPPHDCPRHRGRVLNDLAVRVHTKRELQDSIAIH